ncbi:hypothetical protein GCM10025867_41220 [Frondihabitans sucicola]|uniref:Pr6Pr family membrane protein n=1 Tax=Frondihabitans sucicola TaxID=1268041 RepID=A0ABN6Y410_9MICO|nr:Pr6Pr family membrane protein [Frondihabitans sucicola]BDZ51881.1 hypothetical protein GCM10025867_41220 [Frondihabitans sucicola]
MTRTPQIMAVYRLVFAAFGLVAVISQFGVTLSKHYSIVNFFSYFTNLGNLIAIVVLVIGAVRLLRGTPSTRGWEIVRFCNTVDMVFVGLVFNILLAGTDVGDVIPWVNVVVHMLMPVVVLVDWIILPPSVRFRFVTALVGLVFPIAYSVYSLVRGAITAFYPYPFYNPKAVGGAFGVTLYLVALIIGLAVLSFLVLLVARARTKQRA